MTLLDQLCAVEARARREGRLRFIAGHQYPISEVAFRLWMKQQALAGWKVRQPKYVTQRRWGSVFQEGARA